MPDMAEQSELARTERASEVGNDTIPAFCESAIGSLETIFKGALAARHFDVANFVAMKAAEALFELAPEQARQVAWERFFSHLSRRYRTQYQCYDFEVVDYHLYYLPQNWSLVRGPKPERVEIHRGKYITFLGAAQLFGRYQRVAPAERACAKLRTACLNLSTGGAGPESFLKDEVVALANGGKAVVLQVLSGRSIGCDEFPGTRMTTRGPHETQKVDRLKLLHEIWAESSAEGIRLARKWQGLYVRAMTELIARLDVPVILAWISARGASGWSIGDFEKTGEPGAFPQLVDEAIVAELRAKSAAFVEVSDDLELPYGFVSRFTGGRCPVVRPNGKPLWSNDYYPSRSAGNRLALQIEAAAREFA